MKNAHYFFLRSDRRQGHYAKKRNRRLHALTKCQFPITTADDDANLCSTRTQAMLAMREINWEQSIGTEIKRTKPLPGLCTITKCAWPVFWLAVILFCPCLPMLCTVAFEQIRQAYSSGGCAGLARNAISCVTGFPFHPPADKQEGTIRIIGRFYSDCFHPSIQDGPVPRRLHEAAPWFTTEGLVKRLRYHHELVYRQGVIF